MTTMSDASYVVFKQILALWRKQGKRISWPELQQAFDLAKQVEDQPPPPPKTDR